MTGMGQPFIGQQPRVIGDALQRSLASVVPGASQPPAPQDQFTISEEDRSLAERVHVRHRISHAMEGTHFFMDGLEISGTLASALVPGTIANAGLAIGFAFLGAAHLKEGLRARDAESVLEGAGCLSLSLKGGLETVAMGLDAASALPSVSGSLESVIPTLACVHGAFDIAAGGMGLHRGLREKDNIRTLDGALGVGVGLCHFAAGVGGGIPALLAAGGLLAAKMVVHELHDHEHSKPHVHLPDEKLHPHQH